MPLAGQIIRASDVRRYLGSNSRSTALGSSVTTTETTIAIDVSFTLTASRRVKVDVYAFVNLTGTITASSFGFVILRRNATGSTIVNTDTQVKIGVALGATGSPMFSHEEVLAAGTYAYGVLIVEGTSNPINLGGTTAPVKTATLDIWDMGDS